MRRACAIDVPGAIFDWIEASQPAQARPLKAMTGEPLIDLLFDGRLRLRAIRDRLDERREFARAVGIRLRGVRRPQTYRDLKFVGSLGFVGGALDRAGGGGWGPIVTANLLAQGANLVRSSARSMLPSFS